MIKKLTLYISTFLLAIICIYFGAELFQSKHNAEKISQYITSINNYSEKNMIYFTSNKIDKNNLKETIDSIIDIAKKTKSDAFVSMSLPKLDSDNRPEIIIENYIYSQKDDLFSNSLFEDKKTNWDSNSKKIYSTYLDNSILQITDSKDGFLFGKKKINFVPMSMMYDRIKSGSVTSLSFTINAQNRNEVIKLLENSPNLNITLSEMPDMSFLSKGKAYMFLFLILIPIVIMIITSYTLEIVDTSKEIGLRKMQGQSSVFILKKKFVQTAFIIPIAFLLGTIISSIFVVKHWNALTFEFYKIILIVFIVLLVGIAISLLVTNYYIQKLQPVISTKSKSSLRTYYNVGVFLKTILILLLISQTSMVLSKVSQITTRNNANKVYSNPSYLDVVYQKDPELDTSKNFSNEKRMGGVLGKFRDKLETLNVDYTPKGSKMGSTSEDGVSNQVTVKNDIIITDKDFLKYQKVLRENGSSITFTKAPRETVFLIPAGLSLESIPKTILEGYSGRTVIKIKENQELYVPMGLKSKNAIIIIDTSNVEGFVSVLDTPKNRETIDSILDENGYTKDRYRYVSTPVSNTTMVKKSLMARELVTTIFLFIAFILTVFQNIYIFMRSNSKLLIIKYINGNKFFSRTKKLWDFIAIPYILCGILVIAFPSILINIYKMRADFKIAEEFVIPTKYILIGLLILFAIECIYQFVNVKSIEKKGIKVLKGEI